jgi:hypothetical protein
MNGREYFSLSSKFYMLNQQYSFIKMTVFVVKNHLLVDTIIYSNKLNKVKCSLNDIIIIYNQYFNSIL